MMHNKHIFWTVILTCCVGVSCLKVQHLMLSESQKISGVEGARLQVNCTANVSASPSSLRWVRNNGDGSTLPQIQPTETKVILRIPSLQGSDAGRYACELVMADGTEEKAEFHLFVKRKDRNPATCPNTQFKCKTTNLCLFTRFLCDGKDDCGDGSDEKCKVNPCTNKFRCNNTRCVALNDLCNHIDDCGDHSDEGSFCFAKPSTTMQPSEDDNHFSWLKTTVYAVIVSTIGVVILISSIVIMVYRVKMERRRERRISRALERMHRQGDDTGESMSPDGGEEGQSDQHPFLSSSQQYPRYGNIIVNVNNGVQYMPGYGCPVFMDAPPPYSEVGSDEAPDTTPSGTAPPPYSTIDRGTPERLQAQERPASAALGQNTGVVQQQQQQRNVTAPSVVQNCLGGQQTGTDRGRRGRRGQERNDRQVASPTGRVSGAGCPDAGRNNARANPDGRMVEADTSSETGGSVPVLEPSHHADSDPSNRTPSGSLPSNIDINPDFLESLLASHSLQRETGQRLEDPVQRSFPANRPDNPGSSVSEGSSGFSGVETQVTPSHGAEDVYYNGDSGSSVDQDRSGTSSPVLTSQSTQTPRRHRTQPPAGNSAGVSPSHVPEERRLTPDVVAPEDVQPSSSVGGTDGNNLQTQNELVKDLNTGSPQTGVPDGARVNTPPESDPVRDVDLSSGDVFSGSNSPSRSSYSAVPLSDDGESNLPLLSATGDDDDDDDERSAGVSSPKFHFRYDENSELGTAQVDDNFDDSTVCVRRRDRPDQTVASADRELVAEDLPTAPVEELAGQSLPDSSEDSDSASNALLTEVLRRDRNSKPKPGHLSVQKGQILLHTEEGFVTNDQTDQQESDPAMVAAPVLSGELVVKDGNVLLQPPGRAFSGVRSVPSDRNRPSGGATNSPSRQAGDRLAEDASAVDFSNDLTDTHPSPTSGSVNRPSSYSGQQQPSGHNHLSLNQSSSSRAPSSAVSGAEIGGGSSGAFGEEHHYTPTRHSGELNVKDGCLVLESPKHTPSSQILSHLQGAYAAEEEECGGGGRQNPAVDPIEPVINTKRPAGAAIPRPPLPKLHNTDLVFPLKNHHP
ncbi:uncharacterized protein LOC101857834 [Aplysia californica]|uniref:Uncharacterized protein LOC101857834 n=1 Tax=Aplysia californica TaxID=6500 RepID=A0ABM0K5Q1_APLCA|nr:uncharacterized protein LOC101857834 [Aplysia californica]